MMVLRAFRYFVEEALTSLWRSRLITGLSVITIAVSLFVLGAFLSLASNLADVVARWSDKVQVTFYLEDQLPEAPREGLTAALRADPSVESVAYISREEALRRFRALIKQLGVTHVEVIATAAAREAGNGPEFIAQAERVLGWPITVLSGMASLAGFMKSTAIIPVMSATL